MKIAVVCSGGGMRCAYSAGALYALATSYGFTTPHSIIAASGSAGTAACYLAGGYEEIRHIWTELLSTPKFVSWWRFWRIIDVNYLIDGVLKPELPSGVQMLSKTETKYFIPVTEVSTKRRRYISNDDGIDIFETLRAAKALPFFFGGKIDIEGKKYVDGGFGLTFTELIDKAKETGATHIIAIDNRLSVRRVKEMQRITASDENMVLISNTSLPLGLLSHSKKRLREAFMLGVHDTQNNNELQQLLQSTTLVETKSN